jgi:hypothetical protein
MGTVSWLAVNPNEVHVAVMVCDKAAPTVLSCTPKTAAPFDAAWLEDGVNTKLGSVVCMVMVAAVVEVL